MWVDNDGNVAAAGEAMPGAGQQARGFACLYLAAGFGGGAVVGGVPARGARGNAEGSAAILPEAWPLGTLRAALSG